MEIGSTQTYSSIPNEFLDKVIPYQGLLLFIAAERNKKGKIFYRSIQLTAYADDIDIMGLKNRAVRFGTEGNVSYDNFL